MARIGQMNRLRVEKEVEFGVYLDGGRLGEILLPARYVPKGCRPNDELEVFIYHDSEDRLIATTERPKLMVGQFANLRVVAMSSHGAFLDWGLMKDLLCPFSEQPWRMEKGKSYIVCAYIDPESDRIAASARLDDFLYRESDGDFAPNEAVEILVAGRTELGYKVIVNDSHWGLLHKHEVSRNLRVGEKLPAFIRQIRVDGKIDLCLHLKKSQRNDEATEIILAALKRHDGFIAVSDKSPPALIEELFGLSKKSYKQAAGSLYRQRRIAIETGGIRLLAKEECPP